MPTVTKMPQVEPWRRRLYLPAYTVSAAAHYAGTSPNTVAYWHYGSKRFIPTLPGKELREPLSYLQLVEVAFVATFRSLGVSLQRIRKARNYAAQTLNSEYPFAEYRWLTEGHHVLLNLQEIERETEVGKLIVADQRGQIAWQEMVGERFAQFDYENGLALIWHVAGRQSPIIIDPRVEFGAPSVRGIATWILKGRWEAGEKFDEIEEDFGLTEAEVKQALLFEGFPNAA